MPFLTDKEHKMKLVKEYQKDTPVKKTPAVGKKRAFPAAVKKRGSLTIEAALSLPIFFFFVVAIIYFLMIIFLQSDIQVRMEETARSLGKKAYLIRQADILTGNEELDGETASLLSAGINPLVIKTEILQDPLAEKIDRSQIKGGSSSFYTYHSSFDEEEGILDIVAHYNYRFPFLPEELGDVRLSQRIRSHVWIGRELSRQKGGKEQAEEKESTTVYVTEHGTVYHTSRDCHYLDLSIHSINSEELNSARNASGGKYYPCSCAEHSSGSYYITDYGTHYHSDLNCSSLKRTVREVDLSEVEGMHICPKCDKEH